MSAFLNTPHVRKGAIVAMDPMNPLASVIMFQYNPDTLTRSLTAQDASKSQGTYIDKHEVLRLQGPPEETITLKVEIDAVDQMSEKVNKMGIYPTLSALEMLLYPKSVLMIANAVLAAIGMIEVIQPEAPLTLFVWGPKRILPVRLRSFSITEQEFDPDLNPIRASVDLSLQVLTYQDLGLASVGGAFFMAHQVAKEVMATLNTVNAIISASSLGVNLGG